MHFPKRRRPGRAREESRETLRWPLFIGGGAPVNLGVRARRPWTRRFSKRGRSCYEAAMGQDRAELAIGRIERALARIESAAARGSASVESADGALREAHEALRGRVREALTQIDGLIAAAEQG